MEWFLAALIGFAAGCIIIVFAGPKQDGENVWKWHIVSCFKRMRNILMVIFSTVVFSFLYHKYGWSWAAASYGLLVVLLGTAVIFDIQQKIIPERLILGGILLGTGLLFVNPELTYINAILGAIVVGGALWLVSVISKGALGLGDAKLMGCTGLFLGMERNLSSLAIAVVLSGLVGAALLIKSTTNKRREIPFAPFILAGVLISIL
ncbi:MAG: A24 family peptidase [Clostridia bacterium]|nr:A24 family peptidase [Clostridia bacterium]